MDVHAKAFTGQRGVNRHVVICNVWDHFSPISFPPDDFCSLQSIIHRNRIGGEVVLSDRDEQMSSGRQRHQRMHIHRELVVPVFVRQIFRYIPVVGSGIARDPPHDGASQQTSSAASCHQVYPFIARASPQRDSCQSGMPNGRDSLRVHLRKCLQIIDPAADSKGPSRVGAGISAKQPQNTIAICRCVVRCPISVVHSREAEALIEDHLDRPFAVQHAVIAREVQTDKHAGFLFVFRHQNQHIRRKASSLIGNGDRDNGFHGVCFQPFRLFFYREARLKSVCRCCSVHRILVQFQHFLPLRRICLQVGQALIASIHIQHQVMIPLGQLKASVGHHGQRPVPAQRISDKGPDRNQGDGRKHDDQRKQYDQDDCPPGEPFFLLFDLHTNLLSLQQDSL